MASYVVNIDIEVEAETEAEAKEMTLDLFGELDTVYPTGLVIEDYKVKSVSELA